MKTMLDKNIKELIAAYPAITEILEKRNIGCVGCSLGSCKLRDIIEIHNLNEADEEALFTEMASVFFQGKSVEIPKLPRKPKVTRKQMSPPMRSLVEEHVNIKKVIAGVQNLSKLSDSKLLLKKETILKCIDFIRNYADKFHHAKEEDILFNLFDTTSDILQVRYGDHAKGRSFIKNGVEALEAQNSQLVRVNLLGYCELLLQHIQKEDDILYPWMDRQLSDSQVGQLFSKFNAVDEEFSHASRDYEEFADSLK
jgi:hemerythrin-like domain-containing protein